MRLLTL